MDAVLKYKGFYTDSFGSTPIVLLNDFKTLFVEIDGVPFSGEDFSDFSIVKGKKYLLEKTDRFNFFPSVFNSSDSDLVLCNCTFKIIIPQIIIDLRNQTSIVVDLDFECELKVKDNLYVTEFFRITLTIDGNLYSASGDIVELVLDRLNKQFEGLYSFKNCYGCMYGDYSVFGQNSFGGMLCFVNQKDAYKKADTKDEYMELEPDAFVQEIYCCNAFEPRTAGAGYRG